MGNYKERIITELFRGGKGERIQPASVWYAIPGEGDWEGLKAELDKHIESIVYRAGVNQGKKYIELWRGFDPGYAGALVLKKPLAVPGTLDFGERQLELAIALTGSAEGDLRVAFLENKARAPICKKDYIDSQGLEFELTMCPWHYFCDIRYHLKEAVKSFFDR